MRHLLFLAAFPLFAMAALADDDPEPPPPADGAIKQLDDAASNSEKIGKEKVEARRKALVKRLEKIHADLVKRGQKDKARELKDRITLAGSIRPGEPLDTRLKVDKLLEKASSNGRYRELLHVLYLPGDKNSYNDFTDFGMWSGNAYGGYAGLQSGYWVYVHPRWYIWKEPK